MLLIIISRVTLLNINNYISFAFIFNERYKVYKWLLEYNKKLYEYFDILNPNIILIDTQNNFI